MTFALGPILQWMLQTTIIALVLIPIVIALSRTVLRDRPAAQHALWAVLLLKFITPAIIVWPWALPDVGGLAAGLWARWNGASNAGPAVAHDIDVAWADPATVATPVANGTLDTIVFVLFLLWIIGCVVLAARSIHRIALQARAVNGGLSASPSLARTIAEVAGRMNLLPLPAIIVRGLRSPFVWCLGRLRLAWPEGMAGEIGARECEPDFDGRSLTAARPIIAHELAHIRRRDHWMAWIELVASIIWWWNPLFWIVRRNLRITSEMACDALALAAYPDDRCAYAETLLTLSALPSTRAPALGLAATAGTRHSFERRMSMIVSERATGRHTRPTLLLAGLLAAVSIPAWSFNQTQAEEAYKVQAKRAAAAADKAKRAEIEHELLAHMAMLDEKHAVLQEQLRGDASPEALAELQDARDMLRAKIEALHADHALLTDEQHKYVEADAAALEKRKVDVHQRLAALELKRAALLEQTAGNPDPADLASLEEARMLLIEKMHAEMASHDADAKGKYKSRAKKPPPPDAETLKRQAVKELLHEIFKSSGAKADRAAEEAAAADAHKELLHRYLMGLDKQKRVEEAGADDAADLHKQLLHQYLMGLGRHAEAEAVVTDEAAAAANAELLKKRHVEMFNSYKKALAEEAAAAGQTLTDADRAKLEAHARMLKEELAGKAAADAKADSAKPKN